MTSRQAAKKARDTLLQYLATNDPEGFGCACVPDKWTCGPCTERAKQEPLYRALAALTPNAKGTHRHE